MKWLGKHIVDLIARFRSDVYLDNISAGTIASGGNLGLDSNNKIVKATETTGDITGVGVGAGLSGGGTSGSVTISANSASTTASGIVELATTAETTTGTDSIRVVTPDGLKDGYQGSTNVTILGTITEGAWQATTIKTAYIGDDQITEDKLADTLLAEIDANTAKVTRHTLIDSDVMTGATSSNVASAESVKAYADRPAKQIVLMRSGFKDEIGTDKYYVPLQSELEQTVYYHEMNSFVAPFAGKLLKVMYRGSGDFSGGEISFRLEQIPAAGYVFLTTPTILKTVAMDGPTNATDGSVNMITVDFASAGGTNAFVAGDQIMLSVQSDTDVTSAGSKHFLTLVFEFDFSSLA